MTTVRLKVLEKATANQRKFAENAVLLLEAIVNNPLFQEKVITGSYSGRRFRQDDNLTINADNALILNQIITGKEFKTTADDEITITARLARLGSGTVGRVKPPDPEIITNISFFNDWYAATDTLSLAAHWMHEWLHVSGFRHASKNPDNNDVSYLTGTFVVEVGKQVAKLFSEELASMQGEGYSLAYGNFAHNTDRHLI